MVIRRAFINASLNSPSIILFDDVDHVLKKRSAESSDFQKRLVSCILSLIDGVEEIMHNVIIIATSSRPDYLDPALLRAGRIDKEFELAAPTSSDRLEVMKYILKDLKIKILDDGLIIIF
jgi:transitional endoplasmic reticulum ATPase